MEFLPNNTIKIEPPKKPKKITGTRLGAILGVNKWSTPFATWCEITKTYQEPFEDNIYTIAGKTIEPKQAEYIRKAYFVEGMTSPTDVYGKDYFKKTFGDFFPDNKIFGGMWDYLDVDEDGTIQTVFEMKTTKRAEDWANDVPEYYSLQAALYAYLLGTDNVSMVCSFLDDEDYEHPENFVPNPKNTIIVSFKVSEKYPNFEQIVADATEWWEYHIGGGLSPAFDEVKDADIMKELRKNTVTQDTDIKALVAEAEELTAKIDIHNAKIAEDEKRLKDIKEMLKSIAMGNFREGDKQVVISGNCLNFVLSKSVRVKVDEDKLKADKLFDKYKCETVTYTFTSKTKK